MSINIHAGRMRHQVEVLERLPGSDDNGEPNVPQSVFVAYADVDVKNGRQLAEMGELTTAEVITCMMWYDDRVKNKMFLNWEGRLFEIQHVKPDQEKKAMIITARIETNE